MERMSQQASHTIYRNRSGAAMRPPLRTGAEIPAYNDSILQRLQQVATQLLTPQGSPWRDDVFQRCCALRQRPLSETWLREDLPASSSHYDLLHI
jgi:hypothetical protein